MSQSLKKFTKMISSRVFYFVLGFLFFIITLSAYAAALPTVVPGQNLTAAMWNSVINKINGAPSQANCAWVVAPNAWNNIANAYKTAICPAGKYMAGTRWFQWPSGLDEEHVDAYCCDLY